MTSGRPGTWPFDGDEDVGGGQRLPPPRRPRAGRRGCHPRRRCRGRAGAATEHLAEDVLERVRAAGRGTRRRRAARGLDRPAVGAHATGDERAAVGRPAARRRRRGRLPVEPEPPPSIPPAALAHLVGEPRHDDRREQRQQLLHQAAGRPADPAEPAHHLVGAVAEDVADDRLPVLRVDVVESVDRAVVVLQGREQRLGSRGIRGVRPEPAEQRRERALRRLGLALVDPEPARDLTEGDLAEDVVDPEPTGDLLLVVDR